MLTSLSQVTIDTSPNNLFPGFFPAFHGKPFQTSCSMKAAAFQFSAILQNQIHYSLNHGVK